MFWNSKFSFTGIFLKIWTANSAFSNDFQIHFFWWMWTYNEWLYMCNNHIFSQKLEPVSLTHCFSNWFSSFFNNRVHIFVYVRVCYFLRLSPLYRSLLNTESLGGTQGMFLYIWERLIAFINQTKNLITCKFFINFWKRGHVHYLFQAEHNNPFWILFLGNL